SRSATQPTRSPSSRVRVGPPAQSRVYTRPAVMSTQCSRPCRSSQTALSPRWQGTALSTVHGVSVIGALPAVGEQDGHDDQAVDGAAPVRGAPLGWQRRDDRDEGDAAGDDAGVRAAAAEDGHAADDDRGDGLEQVRVAEAERRLAAVADEGDAGERGEDAGEG